MANGAENGNGTTAAVLRAIGRIVVSVMGIGVVAAGIIYGYAVVCTRVDVVEGRVAIHETHLAQIDKTATEDRITVQGDLREIKTDLKWIRQRLRTEQ